jgi:uncharacterized membrane protein YccC
MNILDIDQLKQALQEKIKINQQKYPVEKVKGKSIIHILKHKRKVLLMNTERLIHGLKTMIAVLIGFSLTRVISFPYAQWVIISILVVMCAQLYVGGVLQKSYIRFLGTLCGCVIALISIELFHSSLWGITIILALSSFLFSYIATAGKDTLSYFGTMGGVTLAIILLGTREPSFDFAAARFLEITVGIFIATMVSQFVFPIHAKTHLQKAQAETMRKLIEFYDKTLISDVVSVQTAEEHDEEIVKSLLKQRQLEKEVSKDLFHSSFNTGQFAQYLFYERQILRAINFMHIAQDNLKKSSHTSRSTNRINCYS